MMDVKEDVVDGMPDISGEAMNVNRCISILASPSFLNGGWQKL